MIIPAIGKQKIIYKDHNQIKFESLDFYINLSKKIIAKIGPTFFSGLSKHMLQDEDAIAFVANAIMMGDWRWKKSDQDKPHKTLYSYRNQCAIWAIKTYITKQYRSNHTKKKIKATHSLNYQEDDITLENILPDFSQKEPVDILIDNESHLSKQEIIQNLFDSNILSDKQKQYLQLYYFDNMTLEKIGKKFNVTREAVRQSIKTAISKIRNLL